MKSRPATLSKIVILGALTTVLLSSAASAAVRQTVNLRPGDTLPASTGEWVLDAGGWWYRQADGTHPVNKWEWIDGDDNGVAECYHFDANGYLSVGTTTPDGYIVNTQGAWVEDGAVQTRLAEIEDYVTGTYVKQYEVRCDSLHYTTEMVETMPSTWDALSVNLKEDTRYIISEKPNIWVGEERTWKLVPRDGGILMVTDEHKADTSVRFYTREGDHNYAVNYYTSDIGRIRVSRDGMILVYPTASDNFWAIYKKS